MKSTNDIGPVYRYLPEYNYSALWKDNTTVRFFADWKKKGKRYIELPPGESEFYDISLGTYCPENCDFCYTSAKNSGVFYINPCETWKKWSKTWYRRKIGGLTVTNAPFQVAIGSQGEPTFIPRFIDFLKTVRETGVVPNYTTSGSILGYDGNDQIRIKKRDELLDATERYCSAVAVSLGNPRLRETALRAIDNLLKRDVYVTLHHIISDQDSVNRFLRIRDNYGPGIIHYHVLLPLVASGRSQEEMKKETFDYLQEKLLGEKNISDISFGAKFIKFLRNDNRLGIDIFPEQTFSKNILLKDGEVVITSSSFDLNPIKIIKL